MNESIFWEPKPEWELQPEHKLNTAIERIEQLEQTINELRAEEARVLNTNEELERSIKRMELELNTSNDMWAKAGLGFTKE